MHPIPARVEARDDCRLWLEFDDGVSGEVDLSLLASRAEYAAWSDAAFFRDVRIDGYGDVVWSDGICLVAEELYAQLMGRTLAEQEAIWEAAEPAPRFMPKPIRVEARDGCRIWLEFDDGVSGEVDVSHLFKLGMFKVLRERSLFERVRLTENGAVGWSDDLELCPDSLYLRLTGMSLAPMLSPRPRSWRPPPFFSPLWGEMP